MRTIKFRIWDKLTDEMYYDALVGNCRGESTVPCVYNNDVGWAHTDSCVVEQFTGLYDKNGTEIYDGDIVKVIYSEYGDDTVHEIKYFVDEYNYPAFDLEPSIDFADGNSFQYAKLCHNIEVIGNVHDNKEILK